MLASSRLATYAHDCQRGARGSLVTDESIQINVPGVFVVVDVRSPWVPQIAAVGDAATAAVAATC
jgi:thioredoxin reductase